LRKQGHFRPKVFADGLTAFWLQFPPMVSGDIQHLCEIGQDQLTRMEYLAAEKTLAKAEELAWEQKDFDSLARLYMPLQEARRQRRQRCGEGTIRLDFLAADPDDQLDGRKIARDIHHGQILIGAWESILPAVEARRSAAELGLYVDVFLATTDHKGSGKDRTVLILPLAEDSPKSTANSIETEPNKLAAVKTYPGVMDIWERLAAPFLAAADAIADPIARIEAYRKTITVDYACELAHQKLADTARKLCVEIRS
jgi:hypothetical protein